MVLSSEKNKGLDLGAPFLMLQLKQISLFPMLFFVSLGVILRDSHGVAQVRFVTGNKILRILKSKGLAPDLPEDLYHLIKKAVAVRKHLERNRKVMKQRFILDQVSLLFILIGRFLEKLDQYTSTVCLVFSQDKDAKFRLILVESRIHRLARYYKTRRVLAPNWK